MSRAPDQYTSGRFVLAAGLVLLAWGFMELGFWQLRRADEKDRLMAAFHAAKDVPPLAWDGRPGSGEDGGRHRQVWVRGHYEPARQVLLDNRIWQGQPGYHVLTPFRIEGSRQLLLVNRGWIAQGPDRARVPALDAPGGERVVRGRLDSFPSVGLVLDGAADLGGIWPAVVQIVDTEALARQLEAPVHALQLLLDADQDGGYGRDWPSLALVPEKNRGYAIQWFAFAALSVGYALYFALWRRRENDEHREQRAR